MPSKKHNELNRRIKKATSPLFLWWNLKNWNSATDLFLKLISITALLLAADFFLLKPEIHWEVQYLDKIDYENFYSVYKREDVDSKVIEKVINDFRDELDYSGQRGVIVLSELTFDKAAVPESQHVFNLGKYGLSDDELFFAWSALKESTVTIGKITITNTGNAPASKIQILPPPQFKLINSDVQSFDLAPNKSVSIWITAGGKYDFEREFLWGDNSSHSPDVNIVWDAAYGIINKSLFILLGSLSVALWLSVVIKDVWFSGLPTKDL